MLPYNRNLKSISRELRRNETLAEQILWSKLRNKQIKGYSFYRQKPVGEYIADFYCPKGKLIIEVDGEYHHSGENIEYDKARNEYMEGLGLRVIRINNKDILTNIHEVIKVIESNFGD